MFIIIIAGGAIFLANRILHITHTYVMVIMINLESSSYTALCIWLLVVSSILLWSGFCVSFVLVFEGNVDAMVHERMTG